MIKTENLAFAYGNGENVLYNINLKIEKGSFVAIIGANGSGKSTLAKHFNALLLPSGGKVYVNGMDTSDESLLFDIRSGIGMVFQNPDNQIVASIVEDEVAFAPENLGVEPKEIRRRVDEALKTACLDGYADRLTSSLSGGQKQRLAIAAALAMNPDCIVFDEAASMLDPIGRVEVMEAVCYLNRDKGMTVISITHYMEEAVKADRVIVIDKGRIVLDGSPREVFSDAEKIKELGLELPQTVELSYELQKMGIKLPAAFDIDECVSSLEDLLRGSGV